jgi:hypothetical protein
MAFGDSFDKFKTQYGLTVAASKFWGRPVLQDSKGNLSCPGFTGNTYSQHQWETLMLYGVPVNAPSQPQTPGICEVTCDKARDVDKKKKKGSDGARITLGGLEPAKVEVRVHVWTPQQLKELDSLRKIIFPGPQKQTTTKVTPDKPVTSYQFFGTLDSSGNTTGQALTIPQVATSTKKTTTKTVQVTQPFDVYHPVLDSQSVSSLIFVRATGPTKSDKVPGGMTFVFEAIEFLQPKKGVNSTTTPDASRSSAPLPSTLENTGGPPGSNPGTADTP